MNIQTDAANTTTKPTMYTAGARPQSCVLLGSTPRSPKSHTKRREAAKAAMPKTAVGTGFPNAAKTKVTAATPTVAYMMTIYTCHVPPMEPYAWAYSMSEISVAPETVIPVGS